MAFYSQVYKLPMSCPDDITGLASMLNSGEINPQDILAIMNMTEGLGNGRSLSNLAFSVALSPWLKIPIEEVAKKVPLIMIGGCSGLISPYAAIFVRREKNVAPDDTKRFSIGVQLTRDLKPEELGTLAQVEAVRSTVKEAMGKADISDVKDVHCVQVKAPWLKPSDIADAESRGKELLTTNIDTAGAYSRGASALGVAVALGEIPYNKINQDTICGDPALYSKIASASAGGERTNCAVIIMGNSKSSVSDTIIGHGIMRDGVDVLGVLDALHNAGLQFKEWPSSEELGKIEHVFVKSAVDGAISCRGRRNVLKTDFLAPYSWLLAKSVIHATVTGVVGDPMMQVSGGGEHQGPLGGGLLAVVARAGSK